MSSPKYNKTKGATFEVDIVKLFRKLGHLAERLRLAGKDDEGDIAAVIAGKTYILELKNVKKIDFPQCQVYLSISDYLLSAPLVLALFNLLYFVVFIFITYFTATFFCIN